MNKPSNSVVVPLFIVYSLGVLLGFTLSFLAAWADLESTVYGFIQQAPNTFSGLECPIFITRGETETINIAFTNTLNKKLHASVRTELSTPVTLDAKIDYVDLEPGQTLHLERTIDSNNIDLGQFIFAKAMVYSIFPLENRETTCGVFVLPFGTSGAMTLYLVTTLSILSMGGSLYLMWKNDILKAQGNALLALAGFTLLAILFSFLGRWLWSIIMIIGVILVSMIVFGIWVRKER